MAERSSARSADRAAAADAGTPADPRGGARKTRQKQALAEVLSVTDVFRSAQDLHLALRDRGDRVGLTTVYNQLRTMADAGAVDVLRAEDGETLYRRCSTGDHHHHLVCRYCGKTVEVDRPDIEKWAGDVARKARFSDVTHTLEIVGTCADCRSVSRAAGR